jgi:hypothetical protein
VIYTRGEFVLIPACTLCGNDAPGGNLCPPCDVVMDYMGEPVSRTAVRVDALRARLLACVSGVSRG